MRAVHQLAEGFKMNAITRLVSINWPGASSILLSVSGGTLLWVHFFFLLPVFDESGGLPFAVLIPLHLWALAHLSTITLVLLLGVAALFFPGVTRTVVKKPITWNQYINLLAGTLSAAVLFLLLSFFISLEMTMAASFELLPILILVCWNAYLIRKLHNSGY